MKYVYIQSERAGQKISAGNYMEHDLYTVGFYDPEGKWQPESDYATRDEAARRVHYLNGGNLLEEKLAAACAAYVHARRDGGVSMADLSTIADRKIREAFAEWTDAKG